MLRLPRDELFFDDAFGFENIELALDRALRRIADRRLRVDAPRGFDRAREERGELGAERARRT